jgi:hypothetical protein
MGNSSDFGNRASAAGASLLLTLWPILCLWLGGRLLRSAESTGDLDAQRAAGSVLTVVGLVGSAAIGRRPTEFWAVSTVGISALRRSIR